MLKYKLTSVSSISKLISEQRTRFYWFCGDSMMFGERISNSTGRAHIKMILKTKFFQNSKITWHGIIQVKPFGNQFSGCNHPAASDKSFIPCKVQNWIDNWLLLLEFEILPTTTDHDSNLDFHWIFWFQPRIRGSPLLFTLRSFPTVTLNTTDIFCH